MRTHSSASTESSVWALSHVRRKARPCLGCGTPVTRLAHGVGASMFCPACLDRPEDPVTAEHYWDLGGNE